jgi:hypothetical protein
MAAVEPPPSHIPPDLTVAPDPPLAGENAPWSHSAPWWRRHFLGISTAAFVILALAGAWGAWHLADHADRASCHARVLCVINDNAGLAGVYGILLAAIGVAVTLLIRMIDEDSEAQRFVRVRRQAVYEAWHNLQHHGRAWQSHDHRLLNRGDISLDRAIELTSDPLAKRLNASEAEQIDHMRRNMQVLARLPWDDGSPPSSDHVRWFIEQALRFIVLVGREDAPARAMISEFHTRDGCSHAATMGPLLDFAAALSVPDRPWAVTFRLARRLSDDRDGSVHVVCWEQAADLPPMPTVHVIGPSLGWLRDPP